MSGIVVIAVLVLGGQNVVTEGEVEKVSSGYMFAEGPLYLPGGVLIFSDIPADTMFKWDNSVFRKPSGCSNGLTLDLQDRLIACEHKNRRVSRTEPDGSIAVLADKYEGKRFNSPNDVIVRSDGTIFFTDPPYGLSGGLANPEAELGFSGVYLITPSGETRLLLDDFQTPNGLALSPDEKTLYIADTEKKHIRAFDADTPGNLTNSRILCELPSPDGMKTDVNGFIWCAAGDGVRVYEPGGTLVETVHIPEVPSNCAFGDADARTLYVTARKTVYKVRTIHAGNLAGKRP